MSLVRVRIAVAVDEDGYYVAKGWGSAEDEELHEEALADLDPGTSNPAEPVAVHFIEADVPLPTPAEPLTIPGVVEGGAGDGEEGM